MFFNIYVESQNLTLYVYISPYDCIYCYSTVYDLEELKRKNSSLNIEYFSINHKILTRKIKDEEISLPNIKINDKIPNVLSKQNLILWDTVFNTISKVIGVVDSQVVLIHPLKSFNKYVNVLITYKGISFVAEQKYDLSYADSLNFNAPFLANNNNQLYFFNRSGINKYEISFNNVLNKTMIYKIDSVLIKNIIYSYTKSYDAVFDYFKYKRIDRFKNYLSNTFLNSCYYEPYLLCSFRLLYIKKLKNKHKFYFDEIYYIILFNEYTFDKKVFILSKKISNKIFPFHMGLFNNEILLSYKNNANRLVLFTLSKNGNLSKKHSFLLPFKTYENDISFYEFFSKNNILIFRYKPYVYQIDINKYFDLLIYLDLFNYSPNPFFKVKNPILPDFWFTSNHYQVLNYHLIDNTLDLFITYNQLVFYIKFNVESGLKIDRWLVFNDFNFYGKPIIQINNDSFDYLKFNDSDSLMYHARMIFNN